MEKVNLINSTAGQIPLIAGSIHTIITSPPYYALRAYEGEQATAWPEVRYRPMTGLPELVIPPMQAELGQEPTLEAYVGHLVHCAREWRRVLRDDGSLWLNLGDSHCGYNGDNYNVRPESSKLQSNSKVLTAHDLGTPHTSGLKPKDLTMVPQRVALALQADGWYLRVTAPWVKRNGMPGSQQDRPTISHEYLFLLSKNGRYYYDNQATKLPVAESSIGRQERFEKARERYDGIPSRPDSKLQTNGVDQTMAHAGFSSGRSRGSDLSGRTRRTIDWWFDGLDILIEQQESHLDHLRHARDNGGALADADGHIQALQVNIDGYSGQHFAVFPPALVEPCLLATCPEKCCPVCGTGWERVVITPKMPKEIRTMVGEGAKIGYGHAQHNSAGSGQAMQKWRNANPPRDLGFRPSCECGRSDSVPGKVLDPFCGSGTTLLVARTNGRIGIGTDISHKYLSREARERLELNKWSKWLDGGGVTAVDQPMSDLPLFSAEVMGD